MTMRTVAIALVACVAVLAGCLERNERLTIRPDGSVHIELSYQSESLHEIYEGDAVPTPGNGWVVEEREQQDADGKTVYVVHAVCTLAVEAPLPSGFDEGDGPSASLRFPTSLTIEAREEGTFYHFRREYEARRWAYIDIKRREIVDEPMKGIAGKPAEALSDAERTKLLRAFAQFEVEKALILAREAQRAVAPQTAQDDWLAFEVDMRRLPDEVDYSNLIRIVNEENERTRERQLSAEVARWEKALRDRLEQSAKDIMGFARGRLNQFLAAYDFGAQTFAVTEDLSDDVFKITVEMPGAIVASNAAGDSGNTARWEFSGQQLRDNAIELMVTSVVR